MSTKKQRRKRQDSKQGHDTEAVQPLAPARDPSKPGMASPAPPTLLERTTRRLKENKLVVLLVLLVLAAGGVAPVLGLWSSLRTLLADTDLQLSTLTGAALAPLDGHTRHLHPSLQRPVYTGGVKASFDLSHNKEGSQTIVVKGIEVRVKEFEGGAMPALAYTVDPSKLPPAGIAKPNQFLVRLSGGKPDFATWTPANQSAKALVTRPDNLLGTNPPQELRLNSQSDDIETFQGTIVAGDTGLYEIIFVFDYTVGGQTKQRESEPILIYSHAGGSGEQ